MAEDMSRSRSGGQGRPCSTLCALPTPSCSTCWGEEHMQIEMRWYMPWRRWVLAPLNCHLRGLHLDPVHVWSGDNAPYNAASTVASSSEHGPLPSSRETTSVPSLCVRRGLFAKPCVTETAPGAALYVLPIWMYRCN